MPDDLPFKKEDGWIYILTDDDRKKFAPKLATDEVWTGSDWESVNDLDSFNQSYRYRRPITQPVAASRVSALQYGEESDLVAKQVQAGQGESEAGRLGEQSYEDLMRQISMDGIAEQSKRIIAETKLINLAREELTRLRTLTAAQSVALEKAEGALNHFRTEAKNELVRKRIIDGLTNGPFVEHWKAEVEIADKALTLIQQAKEVGK